MAFMVVMAVAITTIIIVVVIIMSVCVFIYLQIQQFIPPLPGHHIDKMNKQTGANKGKVQSVNAAGIC